MERTFRRFLIVRNDRIGDVILTLPMAQLLRRHYPGASIAMLVRRYTEELVRGHPCVDEVVVSDDPPLLALAAELRKGAYDVVFHTRPRFRLAFVTWLAGIPVRVGTGYRWYSPLFNRRVFEHRKDARFHELEYNLHLLEAIGCRVGSERVEPFLPVGGEERRRVREMLGEAGVAPGELLVILHPGSGGSAREWSEAKFIGLGQKLSALARVRILVAGGASEEGIVGRVRSAVGGGTLGWAGRLTLREYAALAAEASLFVANSTGPIHLAAAAGAPVIGLYPQLRALSAARWGPYTAHRTIFSPQGKPGNCSECLQGGGCACMDSIAVDDVARAALERLHVPAEHA